MLKLIKIILFSVSCVLGYTLWAELNSSATLPVIINSDIKPLIDDALVTQEIQYDTPDISDYDEIINRPLFFEDRKPYVYVAPEKSQKKSNKKKKTAPKQTEQYVLNAVIITPEKHLAIIQSSRGKNTQRIALGESLDGWTVEAIEPRSVLLKKGNETKNLELEIKTSNPKQKITKEAVKDPSKKELTQKSNKTIKNTNLKLKPPDA